MRKKYIFLDLDGTVIDHKNNRVPPSTIEAIKSLQKQGHFIAIATGRTPALFYGIDEELEINNYIAANGRLAILEDEIIHNQYMDTEIINDVVQMCYENKIDIAFEGRKNYMLNSEFDTIYKKFSDAFHLHYPEVKKDYHLEDDIYQMVMFYTKDDYKKFESMFPGLSFHHSNKYGLDINENNGMKDIGVKAIVEHLDIPLEDTIAVGDGFNDVSMLEYVNIGIAMGNAYDDCKKVADFVTDDVDDDGLYKAFKILNMI